MRVLANDSFILPLYNRTCFTAYQFTYQLIAVDDDDAGAGAVAVAGVSTFACQNREELREFE